MNQKALPLHRQGDPAPRPPQKRLRDEILQALHLHAEGGLTAADPLRRPAQGAGLRHRGEAAQEIDVEAVSHKNL